MEFTSIAQLSLPKNIELSLKKLDIQDISSLI